MFSTVVVCSVCVSTLEKDTHICLMCLFTKFVWFASPWSIKKDNLPLQNGADCVEWLLNPLMIFHLKILSFGVPHASTSYGKCRMNECLKVSTTVEGLN